MSRRVSEFVGVALFAAALIWIIALASYDPNDPVWFFSTGAPGATVNNFAGRVGAFLGELSFQLFGYAVVHHPGGAGHHRLELFLVPVARRRRHEDARREPPGRLLQRVAESGRSAPSRCRASRFEPAATRATGWRGCCPTTSIAPAR